MRAAAIFFCFLISTLLIACHSKQTQSQTAVISKIQISNTALQAPANFPKSLSQSIIDSFTRWQRFKTVAYQDKDSGYIAFLQDSNAVLALKEEYIIAYAYRNNQWKMVDSMPFDSYPTAIYSADMNDNQWPDVVVTGYPQINGNTKNYVLLADSVCNLHCRPDLVGWHMAYCQSTQRMYTWFSGSFYGNGKEISRWQGDSLRLIKGIEWSLGIGEIPVLRRYKKRGGKEITTKVIKNYNWNYPDTALFHTPE